MATVAEQKTTKAAQVQAEEEAERGWKLTAKGRRALERWRKEQEEKEEREHAANSYRSQQSPRRSPSGTSARSQRSDSCDERVQHTPHPGDTALLRRDNRPFSLMK